MSVSERLGHVSDSNSSAQGSRSTLFILLSIVVVDLIGFGIVMPVLPFYARDFGVTATTLGLLMMSYAAAQFVCAPLWGRLSDRVGRRPVILFSVAGTSASLLFFGLAESILWLFVARVLAGGFAANVSVASAYITDVTNEEERTRWMGMLGASFGVGFILGPIIGGLLSPLGYRVPMLVAAGLAFINLIYAAFSLKEPDRHVDRGATAVSASRFSVLRGPEVRRLCLIYFVYSIAVSQLETIFAFFMIDRFEFDALEVAWIFVGMAIVMGGIQGGGMKPLSARYSEKQLVVTGSLLLGLGFVLLPSAPTWAVLLLPLALAAVGRAITQPPLMSLTSMAATSDTRGVVMGTFQSSASLARVVGPVLAGLLYDLAEPGPFYLAAALMGLAFLLSRRLPERGDEPADAVPVTLGG
ncbi:MAG: MFS transporter [Deltaproteobacteria bacterium]|nr:MAG: MFS transporter [Deltaproteobacteria bacterium]